MDIARALQQSAAMPVGIVNLLGGARDPVERPFRKLQRHARAPASREIGDGIERRSPRPSAQPAASR